MKRVPHSKIRKRTGSANLHEETFKLIMARFDRVDKDNKEIAASVANHVLDDLKVAQVVNTHSTYWGLLVGLGTPTVLGVIAWVNGLLSR